MTLPFRHCEAQSAEAISRNAPFRLCEESFLEGRRSNLHTIFVIVRSLERPNQSRWEGDNHDIATPLIISV